MRRHDLDWLRVIVFGLLIFYHTGMFFVPWDFHINNDTLYEWLTWPMWFLNQWRLPILFVISGMGTFFALNRRSGRQYSLERTKRLLIPLLAGMLFIVPPQVYFERVADGAFTGSYFSFWPASAFTGVYPGGNLSWHHLWFLVYLFVYSLLLLPLFLALKRDPGNQFLSFFRSIVSSPYSIYLCILPLFVIHAWLQPKFPVTHALIDDWYTFAFYLMLFFYGFILIAVKNEFWRTAETHRRLFLLIGIVSFTIYSFLRVQANPYPAMHLTGSFVKTVNMWSWILVLFGYAAVWLNQKSRLLTYCNEAVYPVYILHQTITIAIGFYLMNHPAAAWMKFLLMVLGTFGISLLLYEFLIRRIEFLRPLFGLKPTTKEKIIRAPQQSAVRNS